MIDLDAIRQALADAKPLYNETMVMSDSLADAIDRLYANAPVWLAALCDEIERLRADLELGSAADALADRQTEITDRDVDIANLRDHHSLLADAVESITAERDVARQNEASALFAFDKAAHERDAWRACAETTQQELDRQSKRNMDIMLVCDQLVASLQTRSLWGADEALAVYEQLKADSG